MKFTIVLPVLDLDHPIATEGINHLLNNSYHNLIVLYERGNQTLTSNRLTYFHWDVNTRPALVQIWNKCIEICPTDNIIITSWRQRPTLDHFKIIDEKLSEGFGMVAFDGMHMFAFNKHLTTKVGWFDSGFTSGQFEDTDWWYRLKQKNIGIYVGDVSEQRVVNGIYVETCWPNGLSNKAYFDTKWKELPNEGILEIYHEEKNIYDREIYKDLPCLQYKEWHESVLSSGLDKHFTKFHTIVEKYNA